MRFLIVGALALFLALPAQAQLASPNTAGVSFAHVHLNVADIEVHKKLWVDHFDGVVVVKGPLTTVKLQACWWCLQNEPQQVPQRAV
mgnify:CR=1 FL=1